MGEGFSKFIARREARMAAMVGKLERFPTLATVLGKVEASIADSEGRLSRLLPP